MLIEALDHIFLEVDDASAAARDYQAVLGWRVTESRLQLGNMALAFAKRSDADGSDRAEIGLAFAVADLAEAGRRLGRRALPCRPAGDSRLAIDRGATHGVAIDLVARGSARGEAGDHDIIGLDHVVVRAGDPERAVALYGGRLGLDLRLDRTNPERGNRLLFFVCGDLVVEVSHDTRKGITTGPDSIRGMAWRSADIDRSRARIAGAGATVSEIRTGNRAGTRVFTVKSHTAGVPTLVIGGHGLERH